MPFLTLPRLRAVCDFGACFRRGVLVRLAVFLALVLPIIWGGTAFERRQLEGIAQRESSRELQNLAHAFAEEVNATVSTIDMSLLHLRSHWVGNQAEFAQMVERLNRELHGRVILAISVADAEGRLAFTTADVKPGMDLRDRDFIRYHLEGHGDTLFVSYPQFAPIAGKWLVQFTRPMFDAQGRLQGVIIASVEASYFKRFYRAIDLGPSTSVALVRRDGRIITRTSHLSGGGDAAGKLLEGQPYQGAHPAGVTSGMFRRVSRIDGVERNYAWRDLPDYPLLVTVGEAVTDVSARYAKQETMLIRKATVASLLLALLGWTAITALDNRRRVAQDLATAEARWKLALSASGDGVWDCDLITGMATLSPRAQDILDSDAPTIRLDATGLQELVHPEDMARVRYALAEHFAGRASDYAAEHRIRRRSGEWTWVMARGTVAERDENGRPLRMVGTFADIGLRKTKEAHMRHQATHDALTGLPNRMLLTDRLRQAVRIAQREKTQLAVLFVDLDKFKPVNDSYGHAVGDALLVAVGERMASCLRESDTLARVGGDEFVVLLPRCASVEDARTVAENILAQLNRPFAVEQHVLQISGSIGCAMFPEHGVDGDTLLRGADRAMYEAKNRGRSRVRVARRAARHIPL